MRLLSCPWCRKWFFAFTTHAPCPDCGRPCGGRVEYIGDDDDD